MADGAKVLIDRFKANTESDKLSARKRERAAELRRVLEEMKEEEDNLMVTTAVEMEKKKDEQDVSNYNPEETLRMERKRHAENAAEEKVKKRRTCSNKGGKRK